MEQEVKKGKKATIISCKGRGDMSAVPGLKAEIKKLLTSGEKFFVIDMSAVDFVDSSFLGALVTILRSVNKDGGDIKIADLPPQIRSIFELTRLHRLFKIYNSAEEADGSF